MKKDEILPGYMTRRVRAGLEQTFGREAIGTISGGPHWLEDPLLAFESRVS